MKHHVMCRRLLFSLLISLTALVVLPQAGIGQHQVAQEEEEEVPRLKSVVLVRVEVRDKRGNLVLGLSKRDFAIYENGVKQPIFVLERDPFEADGLKHNQYRVGYIFKGKLDGKYRKVRVEVHKKGMRG